MKLEDALAACGATVLRFDPDRYFASLFAPAESRPLLHALYAFNHEAARAGEAAREPMMADIRLQWWREALESARDGRPRGHPASIGLAAMFDRAAPPIHLFEQLLDARMLDCTAGPFADSAALESYAEATSGSLMRIAAHLLDPQADIAELAREAGIAYGLAGILRALPFQAARDRMFLPVSLLAAEGMSIEDASSGCDRARLNAVIARVADVAKGHFARARKIRVPARLTASVLPASLVPMYLASVTRAGADPMHDRTEIPLFRRQLTLLRAALRGRL